MNDMAETEQTDQELEKLKIAQDIRLYHHRALWDEEKHFTWLLSGILSMQVLFIIEDDLSILEKYAFVSVISFVGIILSSIAFRVVRIESSYFQQAMRRFAIEHNKCFYDFDKLSTADKESDSCDLLCLIFSGLNGNTSVRVNFQLIMIVFIISFSLSFFLSICYSLWNFCKY